MKVYSLPVWVFVIIFAMSTWSDGARRLGHSIETRFDSLRYDLKKKLKYDQPLQVVPYNGYGNQETLFLKGRVFENKGNLDRQTQESLWKNLTQAYQRFESDEVPDLELIARFQDLQVNIRTDEEGYFSVNLPTPENLNWEQLWHEVSIEVPAQNSLKTATETVSGKILIPPQDAEFGVISDIDDTVMVTNATSLLDMARLSFMHSPASRLPFAGVADFYQALTHNTETGRRPIFYVSSSPWNLYDFLQEFMALNRLPEGPLLLRDFGLNAEQFFQSSHRQHKLTQINNVMSTYPELSFILIGDSGQHDPEIYTEVVAARPHQVKAIYIRDVTNNPLRTEAIANLTEQVSKHGIDLLLTTDTGKAQEHALANGYISPVSLQPANGQAL
ncbi:MAG: phosphatase domain-containing protein [Thiolinea sp.]